MVFYKPVVRYIKYMDHPLISETNWWNLAAAQKLISAHALNIMHSPTLINERIVPGCLMLKINPIKSNSL